MAGLCRRRKNLAKRRKFAEFFARKKTVRFAERKQIQMPRLKRRQRLQKSRKHGRSTYRHCARHYCVASEIAKINRRRKCAFRVSGGGIQPYVPLGNQPRQRQNLDDNRRRYKVYAFYKSRNGKRASQMLGVEQRRRRQYSRRGCFQPFGGSFLRRRRQNRRACILANRPKGDESFVARSVLRISRRIYRKGLRRRRKIPMVSQSGGGQFYCGKGSRFRDV